MIPRTVPSWQRELGRAIRDPAELIAELQLDPALINAARLATANFGLYTTRAYLSRIKRGDPDDPLLRQILPLAEECDKHPGFSHDPVGDLQKQSVPGLLQKYHGRALMITTGACAIHCRYCFRRHFPYQGTAPSESNWRAVINELSADSTISELILSGGDPLLLSNEHLAALVSDLESIPHLQRLRIHTRLPIVLPSRIDSGLCQLLKGTRLKSVVVIHANHPDEIDSEVEAALIALTSANVTLLNQSVLLKGVNDSAATLSELSESLFSAGVLPYYLHQLDRVEGSAHFEVDEVEAVALQQALMELLPGYLVPRLVREIPDTPSKTPLYVNNQSNDLAQEGD